MKSREIEKQVVEDLRKQATDAEEKAEEKSKGSYILSVGPQHILKMLLVPDDSSYLIFCHE